MSTQRNVGIILFFFEPDRTFHNFRTDRRNLWSSKLQSTGFEALKFCNVQSGIIYLFFFWSQEQMTSQYFLVMLFYVWSVVEKSREKVLFLRWNKRHTMSLFLQCSIPTGHFAHFKRLNPSIDVSELHKFHWSMDFGSLKLQNVRPGSLEFGDKGIKRWHCSSLMMFNCIYWVEREKTGARVSKLRIKVSPQAGEIMGGMLNS